MTKLITITDDRILLPKRLAKQWHGARAELSERGLRILEPTRLSGRLTAWRTLKPLAGTVAKREIARVIADVRSRS